MIAYIATEKFNIVRTTFKMDYGVVDRLDINFKFYPDEALLYIIQNIFGVARAHISDKYRIIVFTGDMFNKEEVAQEIAVKINEFLEEDNG